MSESNGGHLERRIQAGDIIKPWIMLGPFYEDVGTSVRGLTLFERAGSDVGEDEISRIVSDAKDILAGPCREGDEAEFRGQRSRWNLVRRPEKFLSWGEYYVTNHMAAAFLASTLVPRTPGERSWRLITRISSRVVVAVDGEVVFDTDRAEGVRTDQGTEWRFSAQLKAGDNRVQVGMFRLGRMAQIGCRLEVVDDDVTARVPLGPGVSPELRTAVEDELAGLVLGRDLFHPEDAVRITATSDPTPGTQLTAQLASVTTGKTVAEAVAREAGALVLCQGSEIADDFYTVRCEWSGDDGRRLTSTSFDIRKVSPVRVPEVEDLVGGRIEEVGDARRRVLLAHFGDTDDDGTLPRDTIWPQISRYAAGRYSEVSEHAIRRSCEFIAARSDCADFTIQGLLRLMFWERAEQRLSPQINALMKETVLGFKYWVDEPGDTVMFMGSENHRLAFHVAEWMAGQLFPLDEFGNSGQRGLFHVDKGRTYITEWLRQRGRFGFDEWHSNAYFPVCLAPLVNVHEFAIGEEGKLRQMAASVLDYMAFILAADTYRGIFGTTHGRSYTRYIKHPGMESTSAVCWLWYGLGTLVRETRGVMAPVSLATSRYRPPAFFSDIAHDDSEVVESRQRQGVMSGTEQSANFCVYRTPDYMISGLQDHRPGEYESSTHVAQVTLGDDAVIFWSCPQTSGEGSGLRPDYWSGHTALPRVIQYQNVLSLTWRPSFYSWMTHCFFEQERFDDVRFEGDWVLGRVGRGYVGIYSQHGLSVGTQGQYAGRELVCPAPSNTWLAECGRESDWGSFDAFAEAVTSAPITADGDAIVYQSPSIGRFVTGWSGSPTVDGEPVRLTGYPMVESAWASSAFGSGELAIHHGGRTYEIWFNQ